MLKKAQFVTLHNKWYGDDRFFFEGMGVKSSNFSRDDQILGFALEYLSLMAKKSTLVRGKTSLGIVKML